MLFSTKLRNIIAEKSLKASHDDPMISPTVKGPLRKPVFLKNIEADFLHRKTLRSLLFQNIFRFLKNSQVSIKFFEKDWQHMVASSRGICSRKPDL
jgi:hypothetical protein